MHRVGQLQVERFLVDACLIRESSEQGPGTLDPVSLAVSVTAGVEVYRGPCRVYELASSRQAGDAGELIRTVETGLKLPSTASGLRAGQWVRVLVSADLDLEGAEFEISRVFRSSMKGLRRVAMKSRTAWPSTGGSA